MQHSFLLSILLCLVSFPVWGQKSEQVQGVAPDMFSHFPSLRDATLNQAGNELYLSIQSPMGEVSAIAVCKKDAQGSWLSPTVAPFSGQFHDLEPFLAPDDLRLYFVSNRPLKAGSSAVKDYDIWYVQRSSPEAPWSAPINLGAPVNSEHNEFYPSLAANGNLYFTCDAPASKGKDDIFVCQKTETGYAAPASLGEAINSEGYEFNAFIAPDESYLLFSGYNREDGLGSGDLYVSRRTADGSWAPAQNLGKAINSDKMDYCPFVHGPSNTLYFTSRRSLLRTAPAAARRDMQALKGEITQYANGLSRIYQVPWEKVSWVIDK